MQKKQLFTRTITGKNFEMSIKNLLLIITVWFLSLCIRFAQNNILIRRTRNVDTDGTIAGTTVIIIKC